MKNRNATDTIPFQKRDKTGKVTDLDIVRKRVSQANVAAARRFAWAKTPLKYIRFTA